MKYIYMFLAFLWILNIQAQSNYCSFVMLNHEIKHTVEESHRQKKMHTAELENTALESANKSQWNKLKEKVNTIQDRLKIVDLALQGIPSLVVAGREYKEIYKNQNKILEELKDFPPNIIDVIKTETKFIKELKDTLKFFAGVIASYGVINQMERTERKILIDYGLDEVKRLRRESNLTLYLIRSAKEAMRIENAKWNFIINRDKKLIDDIIRKSKSILK